MVEYLVNYFAENEQIRNKKITQDIAIHLKN